MKNKLLLIIVFAFILVSCGSIPPDDQTNNTATVSPGDQRPTKAADLEGIILFDDFSYTGREQMIANGWIIRSETGWPGVTGATWPVENVTLEADPDLAGNSLLRMTSYTAGNNETTSQTQVCHQRKYREGTYAARVRFSDTPVSGPDGDQIVETFYMISPLKTPMDPDYSEMDNEYLPNGGWGSPPESFFVTTWETAQLEPWQADNISKSIHGSLDGWHTMVVQVVDGRVAYFLDNELLDSHAGKYYPEVPMSINFNLWFIQGGLLSSPEKRQYSEDIDWVFFQADSKLTPESIETVIEGLRRAAIYFKDTVPAGDPQLPSPCNF